MGGTEYWIYEHPQPRPESPCPEKPDTAKPDTVNPATESPAAALPESEKQPQIITNRRKTEESNMECNNGAASLHRYGRYENVFLSDGDLKELQTEYPQDWRRRIDNLSEYMASTGRSYKNHYATIQSWAHREQAEPNRRTYRHEDYLYDEEDSLWFRFVFTGT